MHKDYTKARKSIVRTKTKHGPFVVEKEVAAIPGAFSDPKATTCWTALGHAGRVTIPGMGGQASEVLAYSYVSADDAVAKAYAVLEERRQAKK